MLINYGGIAMKMAMIILAFVTVVQITANAQPVVEKYMYVDSPEGLRVRKTPNAKGEVIYLLQNKSGVEVLQVKEKEEILSGIMGRWAEIKFNAAKTVQGWVFSGYLIPDVKDSVDNWINCKSYDYRKQEYPFTIYSKKYVKTAAFEFIAKKLKEYFYPKIITQDFYLMFYYPLASHIFETYKGVFDEVDLTIEEDNKKHYVRFNSIHKMLNHDEPIYGELVYDENGNIKDKHYIISVEQYTNDVLIRQMQFIIYFFDDYIKSPELIDKNLEKQIKIIDVLERDLAHKIEYAYKAEAICKEIGIKAETLSKIQIEKFDFDKMLKTDFSVPYIEALRGNKINFSETEKEILKRQLNNIIRNYK
jgi:hypothetical protein